MNRINAWIAGLPLWLMLSVVSAQAAVVEAVVPQNQDLVAVEYASNEVQTGCGLRATGSTRDDVWLNVLVNVFVQPSGTSLGMFKVVAKKIRMENGSPVLQNGKLVYESIGKINKARIRTDSGVRPTLYQNGESSHSDGYMTSMVFASTMELLSAMTRENFVVAFIKDEADAPDVYYFNKKLSAAEAAKLTLCMKNLRDTAERVMGKGL